MRSRCEYLRIARRCARAEIPAHVLVTLFCRCVDGAAEEAALLLDEACALAPTRVLMGLRRSKNLLRMVRRLGPVREAA